MDILKYGMNEMKTDSGDLNAGFRSHTDTVTIFNSHVVGLGRQQYREYEFWLSC